MVNDLWSERWWSDWALVLLFDGGHAGEVLEVLVLVEEVPMVLLVLVLLLVRRWQLRGKRKMGVDRNTAYDINVSSSVLQNSCMVS